MKDLTVGLTKPTIHMNGSSVHDLSACLENAYAALRVAMEKLEECAPNGRDYYPQGNNAINQAMAEHYGRTKAILEIMRQLGELYLHVTGGA